MLILPFGAITSFLNFWWSQTAPSGHYCFFYTMCSPFQILCFSTIFNWEMPKPFFFFYFTVKEINIMQQNTTRTNLAKKHIRINLTLLYKKLIYVYKSCHTKYNKIWNWSLEHSATCTWNCLFIRRPQLIHCFPEPRSTGATTQIWGCSICRPC